MCYLFVLCHFFRRPRIGRWWLPPGSKLQDVTLVDLEKLCKGTQKAWPDGKSFTLVMHDPESPEMRAAVQKLFGVAPAEVKPLVATRMNRGQ